MNKRPVPWHHRAYLLVQKVGGANQQRRISQVVVRSVKEVQQVM